MYTLSERTKTQVAQVAQDISIYVLWSKSDPLYIHVSEVLKRYMSLSKKIHVETLDPDMNPEKFALISQKYGRVRTDENGQAGLETGIIVVSGKNSRFVPSSDFQDIGGDMMSDPGDKPASVFKAEQAVTSALAGVMDTRKRTICFSQGHGEWAFDGDGGNTLSHISRGLKIDGIDSEALVLDSSSTIPERCNLVVVVGPSRAFLDDEAAVLSRWVRGGHRLMLLLDPIPKEDAFVPTGLEKLTFDAGISLDIDLVLETDPRRLVSDSPVTFIASEFFAHAAVKPLAVQGPLPVVFSTSRSLKIVESGEAVATALAQSSPMSWGETNLASLQGGTEAPAQDGLDREGPLPIAAVSTVNGSNPSKSGRLLVVGDSDFLSEELMINSRLYNQDFWNAMVGFLAENRAMIAIAPKNPEQVHLTLSEADSRNILFTLATEILLIIAMGVLIIVSRRK